MLERDRAPGKSKHSFPLVDAGMGKQHPRVLKVYHYPKCSTCKKALAWLDQQGLAYTEEDIKAKPPTQKQLKEMLKFYEGELRRLFNTSGMDYRALGLKDKIPSMPEKEAFELLRSNGMLVKRPFVLGDNVGAVGFREKEWAEKFV